MNSEDLDRRRRRCLFRASHRGTKEMDWLLGRYAAGVLPSAAAGDVALWEDLVERPDPELYDWIMGHAEPPEGEIGRLVAAIRGSAS